MHRYSASLAALILLLSLGFAGDQIGKLKGIEAVMVKAVVMDEREGGPILGTATLKEIAVKALHARGVRVVTEEELQDRMMQNAKAGVLKSNDGIVTVGVSLLHLKAVKDRPEENRVFLSVGCVPMIRPSPKSPEPTPKTSKKSADELLAAFWKKDEVLEAGTVTKEFEKDIQARLEKMLAALAADFHKANPKSLP